MTLQEAAARGICRVRKPQWAIAEDYVTIDLFRRADDRTVFSHGPWGSLWSPMQAELGMDRPQKFLLLGELGDNWEAYDGPAAPDETPPYVEA